MSAPRARRGPALALHDQVDTRQRLDGWRRAHRRRLVPVDGRSVSGDRRRQPRLSRREFQRAVRRSGVRVRGPHARTARPRQSAVTVRRVGHAPEARDAPAPNGPPLVERTGRRGVSCGPPGRGVGDLPRTPGPRDPRGRHRVSRRVRRDDHVWARGRIHGRPTAWQRGRARKLTRQCRRREDADYPPGEHDAPAAYRRRTAGFRCHR